MWHWYSGTESLQIESKKQQQKLASNLLCKFLLQETCKTIIADEQDATESHFHSMLIIHSYEIYLL